MGKIKILRRFDGGGTNTLSEAALKKLADKNYVLKDAEGNPITTVDALKAANPEMTDNDLTAARSTDQEVTLRENVYNFSTLSPNAARAFHNVNMNVDAKGNAIPQLIKNPEYTEENSADEEEIDEYIDNPKYIDDPWTLSDIETKQNYINQQYLDKLYKAVGEIPTPTPTQVTPSDIYSTQMSKSDAQIQNDPPGVKQKEQEMAAEEEAYLKQQRNDKTKSAYNDIAQIYGQMTDPSSRFTMMGADIGLIRNGNVGNKVLGVAGAIGNGLMGIAGSVQNVMNGAGYVNMAAQTENNRLKAIRNSYNSNMKRAAHGGQTPDAGGGLYLGVNSGTLGPDSYTGEYVYKLPASMEEQANIEIEGGEYLQTPDGQVYEANGPKHSQGGMPIDAEPDTRILSDKLQIGKEFSGKIRKDYGLSCVPNNSYSTVMDKFKHRIGLDDLYDEMARLYRKLDKNEKIIDSNTRALNETVLSKGMYNTQADIDALSGQISSFFDYLYREQERAKDKFYDAYLFGKGGKVSGSKFNDMCDKYGLSKEDGKRILIDDTKSKHDLKFEKGGISVDDEETDVTRSSMRNIPVGQLSDNILTKEQKMAIRLFYPEARTAGDLFNENNRVKVMDALRWVKGEKPDKQYEYIWGQRKPFVATMSIGGWVKDVYDKLKTSKGWINALKESGLTDEELKDNDKVENYFDRFIRNKTTREKYGFDEETLQRYGVNDLDKQNPPVNITDPEMFEDMYQKLNRTNFFQDMGMTEDERRSDEGKRSFLKEYVRKSDGDFDRLNGYGIADPDVDYSISQNWKRPVSPDATVGSTVSETADPYVADIKGAREKGKQRAKDERERSSGLIFPSRNYQLPSPAKYDSLLSYNPEYEQAVTFNPEAYVNEAVRGFQTQLGQLGEVSGSSAQAMSSMVQALAATQAASLYEKAAAANTQAQAATRARNTAIFNNAQNINNQYLSNYETMADTVDYNQERALSDLNNQIYEDALGKMGELTKYNQLKSMFPDIGYGPDGKLYQRTKNGDILTYDPTKTTSIQLAMQGNTDEELYKTEEKKKEKKEKASYGK